MPTMHAVRIHRYGGPEVLSFEEAPRPAAGPGEVLLRVHATSVNPFDCAMRAGYMAGYFTLAFPAILGTDVSGVVAEVGEGVTTFAPGQEVYARGGVMRAGTYADYAVLPAADVAAKPASLDHTHAAAIPHALLTAWQGLVELAALAPGQTVLIHGASGGVGHLALQLAKLRGATVIGTASVNADLAQELGADLVIDYRTTRFEDVVRDVDVVLDLVGGETQERSWAVLKPGGILVSAVQAPSETQAHSYGVRSALIMSAPPIGPVLGEAAALLDAGKLRPHVSRTLPLSAVRTAHELLEGRHTRGKITVQVAE
jgi:NADPH:quinone reductase-like Zn-dependent oxidoreductase